MAKVKSKKRCILFVVISSSSHEVYKLFGDEVPATKRQKILEFKALSPTEKQKKIEDQDKVYKASKLLTSLQALRLCTPYLGLQSSFAFHWATGL